MIRCSGKLPDGSDWVWGKQGLVLVGKARLNKSLIQFSADGQAEYSSDHELVIAKFGLKLKKIGKTTRLLRYSLNQIPYDYMGFPGGSEAKASACDTGDPGSIPGFGRSPEEGNGNPLQYYGLENPMDRGAWWATIHRVARSQTRLSDYTLHLWLLGGGWFQCMYGGFWTVSYYLMFHVVRNFLVFSGFGLKSPASGFQFYSSSSLKTSPTIQH